MKSIATTEVSTWASGRISSQNTRAAWRPVLRPVTAIVIAAQLALVLQPLSALAQEKGKVSVSPLAQSQINRISLLNRDMEAGKAQKLKDQASKKCWGQVSILFA